MDITIENIKWFIKERESIRLGKETTDEILKNSKFCNIYRQHDKVSQWIFKNCDTIEKVLIARLINRIDLLEVWKEGTPGAPFDTYHFLSVSPVVTNSKAYQFYPRKGETIRTIFTDIDKVKSGLAGEIEANEHYTINELSRRLSDFIDRPLHFYFMMVILDCAQMNLIDNSILDTEPYNGPGGLPILKALNRTLEEVSLAIGEPGFHTEHILCEFRKYINRKRKGIPNNRKR